MQNDTSETSSDAIKIHSWNVNGLRAAAKKGFLDWLQRDGGDIVCLQEVRARPEQLTDSLRTPLGWRTDIVAGEKLGYSGVSVFSRLAWDDVSSSIGEGQFDREGRVQLLQFGALKIANVYFPNGSGKNRSNGRVRYKLEFYRKLFETLESACKAGEPILVLGDFNTAHRKIDLARPKSNSATSGFLMSERKELTRWLAAGWVDTWRHFNPRVLDRYTWWSQRFGVRERNVGWRLDMVYASPGAMPYLQSAEIHDQTMGSDHCPVSVTLDRRVLTAT